MSETGTNQLVDKIFTLAVAIVGLMSVAITHLWAKPDEKQPARGKASPPAAHPAEKEMTLHALQRWRMLAMILSCVLVLEGVVVVVFALIRPSPNQIFWSVLHERDEQVFHGSHDGHYDLARLIPSKPDLEKDQDITGMLEKTKNTMDIVVLNGHRTLITYSDDLKRLIARGVQVRVVLFEPPKPPEPPGNDAVCTALADVVGEDCKKLRGHFEERKKTLKDLQAAAKHANFEFRSTARLVPYSFWITDRDQDEKALARIKLHMHSKVDPSFIVSSKDGKKFVENLTKEFEDIWNQSAPINLAETVKAGNGVN